MNNPGTYIEIGGRPAVRFERRYRHPVDRIWAAIIDPAESRFWFPSTLIVEERVGGAVMFSADSNQPDATGVVLAFDPPHRLEFTWGGDEVHFQLRSDGDECVLTLTNVLEATDTAARNASGWTVCLIELDKVISGVPADGPHGDDAEPFEPIYREYIANGMPSGAPFPPAD